MVGSTIQTTNEASAAVENGTTTAIEEPDMTFPTVVGNVMVLVMLLLMVLVLVGWVGWWVYIIWHTSE